jgi:O-antigen/teichoic acid export membrane protein
LSKLNKLATGVGWGTVSVVTVTVFQLVFMAVMARLLDPAHFGLVAIANVSLRFFAYFAQMGIAPALIQKPNLDEGDIRAALALSLGTSSFFCLLALGSASLIEHYFEMTGLGAVTQVLALNFIISGFSAVSLGLMRRNGAFRAIAIIEIISYVGGYGLVGLIAANAGAGVWALVAAFMAQTTLSAILSYAVIRYPLGLRHTAEQRSHFLHYGGKYSVIGFIEFLSSNIDALLVGKLLGASPAGFYSRAVLLANLPVQQPANVLTNVLFPIMSSVGNQHDKQSVSLQLSALLVGSYAFAVGAGIYAAAPDIVKVLLGNKWLETIPMLQVLAWSVGPLYVSHVAGVTLDSMNQLAVKLKIQFSLLVLMVILFALFAPSGSATTVAMVVVVTEWVRVIVMSLVLVRLLKIPVQEAGIIVACVAIVAVCSGLSILVVFQNLEATVPSFIRLGVEILAGAIGLLTGILVVRMLAARLSAIRFLAIRAPRFAKLLLGQS